MGRMLKRNDGTEAPSNLVFFDTESYIEEIDGPIKTKVNKLRLWCGSKVRLEGFEVTRRNESYGFDSESFWSFLDRNSDSEKCTWVFAHNLAFDLTLTEFWKKLDERWFVTTPMKCKPNCTNGTSKNSWIGKLCLEVNPFWLQVRRGKKTYKFVDTTNYWQLSLAKLAKCYDLEKMDLPSQSADNQEWLAYCWNDVHIIQRAICHLIVKWKESNCGVFQPTAASLALTNFRHTCNLVDQTSNSVDIVCQPSSVQNALERESYFGGRIQAFFIGERFHKIYHLDCNSLYPKVMRDFSYPRRFVQYLNGVSLDYLRKLAKVYGIVASVRISSRHAVFPVRIDGRQYHCSGEYWTALCGNEIIRAIESSSISRIGTVQVYSVAPIFRDWVDYWHGRKVAATRMGYAGVADREFAKLLLNSLSGKWAQHGRRWVDCPGQIPLKRWGGYPGKGSGSEEIKRFRGIGGNLQVLGEGNEPDYSFPAISAFITANAREYMRTIINRLPEDSVYYMATDSLICGQDAFEILNSEGWLSDSELGKFKLIGEHEYCCIHGPNDYVLDSKQILSGPIGKAVIGANGNLSAEIWENGPTLISNGPRSTVQVKEIPVWYPSHTNRGRIRDDGYWEPYRITDDPAFTDRPRKGGYFSSDLLGMEPDRIQLDA